MLACTGELTWADVVALVKTLHGLGKSKIGADALYDELHRHVSGSEARELLSTAAWKRWTAFVQGKVTKVVTAWRQAHARGRGAQHEENLRHPFTFDLGSMRSTAGM